MTLGDIIKEYRTINSLSMDAFSEKSGISKSYISLLEKNKHPKTGKQITPSLSLIKSAANAMGIDFSILLSRIYGAVSSNALDTDFNEITEIYTKLDTFYQERVFKYAQEQLKAQYRDCLNIKSECIKPLYFNIKDRRLTLGMTQSELAAKVGYADKSMVAKIENGKIDLPQSKIELFAQALETTPLELMGWIDEQSEVLPAASFLREAELREFISNKIAYYLYANGKSQAELAEFMGVSQATVSNWCNAIKLPRIDKFDRICSFLAINRSDLMSNAENVEYYTNKETAEVAQQILKRKELKILFDVAKDAKPEDLKTVHIMLAALKKGLG